jgi:outer membrane lipoprotein-sorting protein
MMGDQRLSELPLTSLALLTVLSFACAEAGFAAGAPLVATPMAGAPAPIVLAQAERAIPATAPPQAPKSELVFAGETDEAVVDKVFAYLDGITTLSGDFTQAAPSGAISTGKFYLRRPGLLRFEYDKPSPLLIVANGGMVYVRDDSLETTDSYPVGKTPLKFLLRKKVELDDAKIVGVDRGVDTVSVSFISTDEETEGELSLILNAPDLRLREWIVRDPQNGVTIVTLDNVQQGITLANRLFETPETKGTFLKN